MNKPAYGAIYVFTNGVNNKQYVGLTAAEDPEKYCRGHINSAKNGRNKLFYKAIRKYGSDNFTFEIIGYAEDQQALDVLEDFFILTLGTLAPFGYNMKRGGGGLGKFSELLRLQHKDVMKNAYADPLVRENKGRRAKEVHAVPENREIFLEAMRRKEKVDKCAAAMRVHHADPIYAKQHAKLTKEGLHKPENRKNHLEALDRIWTPERREEQRRKIKIYLDRPGDRERRIAILEECRNSPIIQAKWKKSFGKRIWINDGTVSRRLKVDEVIPDGWVPGRVKWSKK